MSKQIEEYKTARGNCIITSPIEQHRRVFAGRTDWENYRWFKVASKESFLADLDDALASVDKGGALMNLDYIADLVLRRGTYDEEGTEVAAPVMGGPHYNLMVTGPDGDRQAVLAAVDDFFVTNGTKVEPPRESGQATAQVASVGGGKSSRSKKAKLLLA